MRQTIDERMAYWRKQVELFGKHSINRNDIDLIESAIGSEQKLIESYIDMYIDANDIVLTEEQYRSAYRGVEFWLNNSIDEAVSDAVTSVI